MRVNKTAMVQPTRGNIRVPVHILQVIDGASWDEWQVGYHGRYMCKTSTGFYYQYFDSPDD
jgi:hypothetical protein